MDSEFAGPILAVLAALVAWIFISIVHGGPEDED